MAFGKKVDNPENVKKAIESLSNMVFGLALSIGTLALITNYTATTQEIISGLETFAFSFLLIIFAWFRYTSIFEISKIEDSKMMYLNLILLFFVVIEPYLFSLLNTNNASMLGFTSELYAIDMAGVWLILGAIYEITIRRNKDGKKDLATYTHIRNGLFLTGAIFLISLFVVATGYRIELWYFSFFVGLISRRIGNLIH